MCCRELLVKLQRVHLRRPRVRLGVGIVHGLAQPAVELLQLGENGEVDHRGRHVKGVGLLVDQHAAQAGRHGIGRTELHRAVGLLEKPGEALGVRFGSGG